MRVPVAGAELFCSERGSGPPCLVPSAVGASPYERMTPPQLAERLRLVYVELRGGGRSTGDPADLTFDVLADDLDAVRASLGAERVAVLGHSILGMVAVEYARRRPERVSHLILAGGTPSGDMAALGARAAAFFEEDASPERRRVLQENLARLPADAGPQDAMLAQTPARFYDARFDQAPLYADASANPALLQQLLGTLAAGWDVAHDAESLRVPIFIAHGRYDYTVPYRMWDGIVAKLPDATFELFERSGHQPFFEEPEAFAEALASWMARRS